MLCVGGFLPHQEFGDTSRLSDPVHLETASDPRGSRFSAAGPPSCLLPPPLQMLPCLWPMGDRLGVP